jgi:nitroreductase
MDGTPLLDVLSLRRSVAPAELIGPGPTPAQLHRLLSIASRVPDHGKLTPWRFLVFAGAARERAGLIIEKVYATDNPESAPERLAYERARLSRAPLVVTVVSRAAPHPKIPEQEQWLSAGALCMNLVIAANAMGFATSWLTGWFAYDRRVLVAFGVGEAEKIAGFIHIGRAQNRPADRIRPTVEEVTQYF